MATYVLTINGVSRSFLHNEIYVDAVANQRHVLRATIYSAAGAYRPTLRHDVVFTENGTTIFAGIIVKTIEEGRRAGDSSNIFTRIECADYNQILERFYVTATWPAGTLKSQLEFFISDTTQLSPPLGPGTTNWLGRYGVTLSGTQADGPSMPEVSFFTARGDEVLNRLKSLSGWEGSISYGKVLSMSAAGTEAAPFNITKANRNAIGDVIIERTHEDYANRIIIAAGQAGTSARNDNFTGDGSTDTFVLSYNISLAAADITTAVVTVDGVQETISDVAGADWQYLHYSRSIKRTSAPGIGAAISITYTAESPVWVDSNDESAISAIGIYEKVLFYPGVSETQEAEELADAKLSERLQDKILARYDTYQLSAYPSQAQTIALSDRNISSTFLIQDIRASDDGTNSRIKRTITAAQGTTHQPTDLDTIRRWSEGAAGAGGGGGSRLPTAVSASGMGVPPYDTMVLYNNNGFMGAADGLRYVSASAVSAAGPFGPQVRILNPADPALYTRLQVISAASGDFELESKGGIQIIADNDAYFRAGSGGTGDAIIQAAEHVFLEPNNGGPELSVGSFIGGVATFQGVAAEQIRITSLPYTMDTSALHTVYLVDTTSSGTFNLAGLSATFGTRPTTGTARIVVIKKLQTGNLTIDGNGSDTIDGSAVLSLDAGNAIQLVAGPQATTNWQSFGGRGSGGSGGSSGGSMSVAGNDGDVQYNASGTLSGISLFNYDDGKAQLRLRRQAVGNSTLEIENTLDGTSAGGPIAATVLNANFSEIGFGMDFLSDAAIARQVTPGRVQHTGTGSGTIGFDLFTSQTVSATLNQSAVRRAELLTDGTWFVHGTAGHLGTSAYGAGLYAGRNADNSAAAGWIGFDNKSAAEFYIWPDADGLLRLGDAPPTADNAVSDKSGHFLPPTQFIRKTSDEAVSSTTAYQSDDSLVLSIGSNQTWETEWNIAYDGATGADFKWAFNAPTSATGRGFAYGLGVGAANGTFNFISYSFTDLTDALSAVYGNPGAIGFPSWLYIKLLVITGSTAGNVTFRWTQATSSGTPNTVYANSYIMARRVG